MNSRRKAGRRLRLGKWIVAGSVVVVGILVLHPETHAATVVLRSNAHHPPHLEAAKLSQTWHGQPVYLLANESRVTLHHLILESWSGSLLPFLTTPSEGVLVDQGARSFSLRVQDHGPYDLSPGDYILYAAPAGVGHDASSFTVLWDASGIEEYENIHAGTQVPPALH